jgi:hypothetical protein
MKTASSPPIFLSYPQKTYEISRIIDHPMRLTTEQQSAIVTTFIEVFGKRKIRLFGSLVSPPQAKSLTRKNVGINNLIAYIQAAPGQRAGEMVTTFATTQHTIERWLKQLKAQEVSSCQSYFTLNRRITQFCLTRY